MAEEAPPEAAPRLGDFLACYRGVQVTKVGLRDVKNKYYKGYHVWLLRGDRRLRDDAQEVPPSWGGGEAGLKSETVLALETGTGRKNNSSAARKRYRY